MGVNRVELVEAESRRAETSRRDLAAAIYGVILATALIGAFSEQKRVGPVATFIAVMVSAVIFWLAHAYAEMLAEGMVGGEAISWATVRKSLNRQLPLVFGALPPAVVLLATPLDILSEDNSENLAILVGIALLAIFGYLGARRSGAGPLGTVVLTAISISLGVVMVALKSAIH